MRASIWLGVGVSILLAACSSTSKKTVATVLDTDLLFPLGEYRHSVKLEVLSSDGSRPRKYSFEGVLALRADAIHVVALSGFSTTVFKLDEDRVSGEIKSEVYVEPLKKLEPKIREYYAVFRQILIAHRDPEANRGMKWLRVDSQGRPREAETLATGARTRFVLRGYDSHSVPEQVVIENPAFKVEVEVTGYAL